MTEQPTTAAGRPYNRPSEQLRGWLVTTDRRQWSVDRMNKALDLAYEQGAEARQPDGSALRTALKRIAGASPYRVPCENRQTCRYSQHHKNDEGVWAYSRRMEDIARTALAALPPSAPPALDVERLDEGELVLIKAAIAKEQQRRYARLKEQDR